MIPGAAMVKQDKLVTAIPPRNLREPLGASNPPGPLPRRPISTIPPPPLPVVQPQPIPLIPRKTSFDEDCVTKRLSVDVFKPVEPAVTTTRETGNSVDSIHIAPDVSPQVSYKESLFEIDEDAVTKEIRVRRIEDSSDGIDGHEAAVRIRTLPSDDTLWKSRQPSSRTGLLRLNFQQRLLPKMVSIIEKATALLLHRTATSDAGAGKKALLVRKNASSKANRQRDKHGLRLSVNTYTRDLYREIRNALNPASAGEVPRLGTQAYTVALHEPPRISVNALLLRRSDKYSLLIRGKASHPIAIRDIMVFADKKKVLYLSNAVRDDAGYMEFSADVPLLGAVSTILVVARHDDEVMGSQSLLITKS